MPTCKKQCGSSSSSSSSRPSKLIKPISDRDLGRPLPEKNDADPATLDILWDQGDFESKEERPCMIRWKSGTTVDQRLPMLLESFYQEIYVKREDFFKKTLPCREQDEFAGVLCKIDAMLSKNNCEMKNQTLQKSLSVGPPSSRRLELFHVKTPLIGIIVRNSDGKGGAATTAQTAKGNGK